MDLKQIEYFLRVAERRSFSRAEMLDVAQPTLSRQVRLLEQELGQHLLYRNGRGVEPTEAGLRFVEHARALLAWPSAPGKTCAACARRPPARCRWACRRASPGC